MPPSPSSPDQQHPSSSSLRLQAFGGVLHHAHPSSATITTTSSTTTTATTTPSYNLHKYMAPSLTPSTTTATPPNCTQGRPLPVHSNFDREYYRHSNNKQGKGRSGARSRSIPRDSDGDSDGDGDAARHDVGAEAAVEEAHRTQTPSSSDSPLEERRKPKTYLGSRGRPHHHHHHHRGAPAAGGGRPDEQEDPYHGYTSLEQVSAGSSTVPTKDS